MERGDALKTLAAFGTAGFLALAPLQAFARERTGEVARAASGKIERSPRARAEFKRSNPCPSTGLAGATLLFAAGAFILAVGLVIGFVVWQWERVLFVVAFLAAFGIGAPLFHAIEARALHTVDELFLLGLCACVAAFSAASVGQCIVGGIAQQNWNYGLGAAVGTGFVGLALWVIHLLVRRAARRNSVWTAPVPDGAKVIGDES